MNNELKILSLKGIEMSFDEIEAILISNNCSFNKSSKKNLGGSLVEFILIAYASVEVINNILELINNSIELKKNIKEIKVDNEKIV